MYERLEPRRLLSISLSNGTLAIAGTAADDVIDVNVRGGFYRVFDGTVARRFALGSVKRLTIDAAGGNDRVTLNDPFAPLYGRASFPSGVPTDKPVNARVFGGDGDDTITSGGGSDTLDGGRGNDRIAGQGGADVYAGGEGADTADFAGHSAGVKVTLDDVANDGPVGGGEPQPGDANDPTFIFWPFQDNVASDIENLAGGDGNDTLTGDARGNAISGGGGVNVLSGGDGNDTIVSAASGVDDMSGGAGSDVADYSSRASFDPVVIVLDDLANDGQPSPFDAAAGERDNVHSDIENVWGGAGDDRIVGGKKNNVFAGGRGNDTLLGGGGSDILIGDRGNDVLNGGRNDADLMRGGAGNDTADYSGRGDALEITIDGIANDGYARLTSNNQVLPREGDNVGLDIENIIGGGGADVISGSSAGNALVGGAGDDTLHGFGGRDLLRGGDGADRMTGGGPSQFTAVAEQTGRPDDGLADTLIGGRGVDYAVDFDVIDVINLDVERGRAIGITTRLGAVGGDTTGWAIRRGDNDILLDVATNSFTAQARKNVGNLNAAEGPLKRVSFTELGERWVIVVDAMV
ncbi:MAG TPA: calcium-binding protein [Tepidisphaeraceae bacterium]|nr:calcium-binding protein [Tepidisphaeraceae bacterium]